VKRDKNDLFLYSPFNSAFSESLVKNFGNGILSGSSLLLIYRNEVYTGSKAIIKISEMLQIAPLLVRLLRNIPVKLLDFAYKTIASNRYRLFGRCESCSISKELPGSDVRYR
jgi:predicted DCC family thiol-disulfide oxidoreductase YuxK